MKVLVLGASGTSHIFAHLLSLADRLIRIHRLSSDTRVRARGTHRVGPDALAGYGRHFWRARGSARRV
jgi:hypothetical protein